jgi:hypothetical protein
VPRFGFPCDWHIPARDVRDSRGDGACIRDCALCALQQPNLRSHARILRDLAIPALRRLARFPLFVRRVWFCVRAPASGYAAAVLATGLAGMPRALQSAFSALFLKYCSPGTVAVRSLRVTVPALSPVLGTIQSGEGRPMGSTHPPLESLLTFSQTCLEGFEHSRLNRISILRKEFRAVAEEWIEVEVDRRVARWILESREARAAGSAADQDSNAEMQARLEGLCDGLRPSERLAALVDDVAAPKLLFDSSAQIPAGIVRRARVSPRNAEVSRDASAALHSLERFAGGETGSTCKRSIRSGISRMRQSVAGSALLPFHEKDLMQVSGKRSSPVSCARANTTWGDRCAARRTWAAGTFSRAKYAARLGRCCSFRSGGRAVAVLSLSRFAKDSNQSRGVRPRLLRVSIRHFEPLRAAAG